MKTKSLIILKLLGLVLVYLEAYPNQMLSLFLFLSLINLWLLRLTFPGRTFLKFSYIVDVLLLVALGEVFLAGFILVPEICHEWLEKERLRGLEIRDQKTLELHDKENLIMELMSAQHQIEQLTKVSERARISADIHDHAGHDIMGAFMALQLLSDEIEDELFDEAMGRLSIGVEKIRTAVHNIKPDGIFGIDAFKSVLSAFKEPRPDFKIYGDFNQINQLQYNILEAVLKEGLTNIAKHANPTFVQLELTVTATLIHFKMINNGLRFNQGTHEGIGMKNLRRRAESVGGTFHTRKEDDHFYLTLTLLQ